MKKQNASQNIKFNKPISLELPPPIQAYLSHHEHKPVYMTHETYVKIEPLLSQAQTLLREASITAIIDEDTSFIIDLDTVRCKLSDILRDLTLSQLVQNTK